MDMTIIQKIAIWCLPVIFAITLHEVAHGWVASKFGDQTARLGGRLTLNPLAHVDLFGTILIPLIMLLTTNFVFGWAKPVPVDPRNMKNPRKNMAVVSAAGPIANLIMAIIWGAIIKIGLLFPREVGLPLVLMGQAGIMINVLLAVFNCIPLPPLDGGRILENLASRNVSMFLYKLEPYGFFILIFLLFTNVLTILLDPIVTFLEKFILSLFGLI